MLTAELRRAIWNAAGDAAAAGELPAAIMARHQADASSLRPVPDAFGGAPGRYASTLPYLLATAPNAAPDVAPAPAARGPATPAAAPGAAPAGIASILADRLGKLPWVAAATVTGGYLCVTVTADALDAICLRIAEAGSPACARSDILRGTSFPAAPPADIATASSWPQARARLAAEVCAGLARAAGATIAGDIHPERLPPDHSPPQASAAGAAIRPFTTGAPPTRPFAAEASGILAFAGRETVRYALLRQVPGAAAGPVAQGAGSCVRHHLDNPVYAVRYAHAHAASTLRQAADLGFAAGDAAGHPAGLLAHPAERVLLSALSWLPERVAGSARRGQPRELALYLEELARTYQDCGQECPALPFGGHRAPPDQDAIRARLLLVAAVRTAVAAGLALLGVSAPDRL